MGCRLRGFVLRTPEPLLIAAGDMRNAEAIVLASNPSTTWSINGARTVTSIAGCAQANSRASRRSGISDSAAAPSSSSAVRSNAGSRRRDSLVAGRRRLTFVSQRSSARLRDRRAAPQGPIRQGGCERLGQRILSSGDVARASGEKGDEFAVTVRATASAVRRASASPRRSLIRHAGVLR